ncbi:LAGLIDADG family homing endonuclease [Halapricum desulfuricans]|uniref:DNA helicase n=1 Tax=Halapricum desulfuricans TaxID=2841257 RepID=A0A897N3M2_9EURY|nr:LAGLIDADG family homing endonuclease [Halapricum desulfuricans]QSG05709.1 putative ATPase involved in replication control, Cdc46/Mcm family [Halapricum desulfuricans]
MATADNTELIDRFEEFYRDYYRNEIGELAQKYPSEQKSLFVDWQDLYRFDPDLAEDVRNQPEQLQEYAEEALRLYDLPVDVKLGQAHVRIENLPEATGIRDIRADHRGQLISVQGIVRKATEVRPKVTDAAFECQRCGTLTRIPQTTGDFQEPHECQGCERQGPFRINFDQSEFIDAQKIRVQESPEGLRGGETPQSIDVNIEDDITGNVTAGDHVRVTGVLKLDQRESGNEKTPMFDTYMDGMTVEIEDEQFEEMDITDEDKKEIVELSNEPDIYEQMVGAIAPSIYGYEQEKLSMILQLFSGVSKDLPDGSRIRGDLHMLLIGDPGTGKSQMLSYIQNIAPRSVYTSGKGSSAAGLCVTGDTVVQTDDGFREIRDIVEPELPDPVVEETAVEKQIGVQTFDRESGEMVEQSSSHVWRMPEKQCRRVETRHGKELEASVNTPVLTCGEDGIEWTQISDIEAGDHVAVPRYDGIEREERSVREFVELTNEKVKLADDSVAYLRDALVEEFGTLRDAAAELDLSEDFIYLHLKNRHVPVEKLDRMLDATDTPRDRIEFERLMVRHGDSITLPETFDEDLLYLLGLVFGDGDIALDRGLVRVSNSDERLLERAADIFAEKFDKRPDIEYQDDRVPCIRVNSVTIARLFSNAGMESPKENLALAPELTTAAHADAFLRGLMDADGSVSVRDDGGSSVLLSTISDELARQIQLLLETCGVQAKVRERDRRGTYERADGHEIESKHVQYFVEMYGADIDRFAEAIGFESSEKRAALERIVGDERHQPEMLPIGQALTAAADGTAGAYHTNVRGGDNPGRARARSMLDDLDLGSVEPLVREAVDVDLRWDEVVAAVDTGEKEVFDLTVPETHNFVGNGVVTHNTAAAVRDDFGDGQQWTLEAGALVLADQGIAAVDELDKMRCVTGDTLVHLEDGIHRIRDVAYDAVDDGEVETLSNGRTIRDVDLRVWTMTDSGQLVTRPVSAVHEYDAPEDLTRVTLQTGERLTTTADHPFFARTADGRVERAADELDAGDWVYVPRDLRAAASDGGVVATASDGDSTSGEDSVSPALGAVLGYLAGDGNVYYDREEGVYGIRFTNAEEELLADFEDVCRTAFDAEPVRPPSEQRDDGVETVRLPGKSYADAVLDAGMNLETYDGKRLPEAVSKSSRATKAAFLRALADSEGSVDDRNVRIFSSSYELLLAAKQLLLEFGITSQIQTRERADGRDVYLLTITDADSLNAFDRHVGFTLDRKQEALASAVAAVSGDRTILDVIPHCGSLLEDCRESLRLYQSECGLNDVTYCNFENEDANISIRAARTVLDTFEERVHQADRDRGRIDDADWETLEQVRRRYHVSQSELSTGTSYSQQQISRRWGSDPELQPVIRGGLDEILSDVAATDLTQFRELVYGDVKWRQVQTAETVQAASEDDQIRLLREELAGVLGCSSGDAVERAETLLAAEPDIGDVESIRTVAEAYDISYAELARAVDVAPSTVSRWVRGVVETDRMGDIRDVLSKKVTDIRRRASELLDEIEARRKPNVYDLTVEGTHNFVANGMVVHNSEDRSAMHQALEQQSISVSKAGINATLKSRCSLLGAANPKYGRFDQYEPIGEQIDLEPALISRFDLIFTVTDKPNEEEDRKLAQHILTTNYAGELHTHRQENATPDFSAEEVETVTEEVDPTIDPELLRKYIAYAKRNCFPTMTEEAKDEIESFYVDLRSKGQDEDAAVPVTARKIEALIRLAEASARVRLSDTVEQRDAERVIEIVRSSLQDIGVDPETGELDADVVETGTSKSQRDRIQNIKGIIADIQDEYDDGAPVEVVIERAEEVGIDESKAEHEIEKLKQQGEIYEPTNGNLRTT